VQARATLPSQLDGNLSQFKSNWIETMRVENLVVAGKNSCAKKYDCKILPNTLVLELLQQHRKFFHISIFQYNCTRA
jgi:galacturan 1,4-alpha-galacturonidase